MTKSFQEKSIHFDSDLDAILNRVYGSSSNSDSERRPAVIPQSFNRNDQDSQELRQALADLRDRRERAQSTLRMKAEIDYLQEQIKTLKSLGNEIEHLRQQIELAYEDSQG